MSKSINCSHNHCLSEASVAVTSYNFNFDINNEDPAIAITQLRVFLFGLTYSSLAVHDMTKQQLPARPFCSTRFGYVKKVLTFYYCFHNYLLSEAVLDG